MPAGRLRAPASCSSSGLGTHMFCLTLPEAAHGGTEMWSAGSIDLQHHLFHTGFVCGLPLL